MNPIFTELPTKLGLYVLEELLGERENSELYAATQSYVDRAVVLEVLRPQSTPEQVMQFQENIRQRASVSLPHVCAVLESVQTGAYSYLIQERPNGISLSAQIAQGKRFNYAQGFSLVQAVAELYSSCQSMGLAALPLDASSIYMHHGEFSFLSPVVAGVADAEHRDAQMIGLAYVLEQVLLPNLLTNSKLAVVIHWLKNGYGGTALEWAPLLAAFDALRVQKGEEQHPEGSLGGFLLRFAKKRYLKRIVRNAVQHYKLVGCAALAVLLIGFTGFFVAWVPREDSSSDGGNVTRVCCDYAGAQWSVYAPVSLEEYARFLKAYGDMTKEQQEQLHEGMPPAITSHQPLNWEEQLEAANEEGESGMSAPVRGVSYWDALTYARFAKAQLASVELVQTARKHFRQKHGIEEWTSTRVDAFLPYSSHYVVCPPQGDNMIRDINPELRSANRGFRVAQQTKEQNPIPEK